MASETAQSEERLYDDNAPMADGEVRMTAAENVLAWLLIEKVGVCDDEPITPRMAQDTLALIIDGYHKYEEAAAPCRPEPPDRHMLVRIRNWMTDHIRESDDEGAVTLAYLSNHLRMASAS